MGMIPRLNNSLRNGRAQDPKTEEGEAEPQRDQEHAHRVFDIRGIVQMNLSPKARP